MKGRVTAWLGAREARGEGAMEERRERAMCITFGLTLKRSLALETNSSLFDQSSESTLLTPPPSYQLLYSSIFSNSPSRECRLLPPLSPSLKTSTSSTPPFLTTKCMSLDEAVTRQSFIARGVAGSYKYTRSGPAGKEPSG